MSKRTRQNTLLELVDQQPYRNQEELRRALVRKGFDVTQATLSPSEEADAAIAFR